MNRFLCRDKGWGHHNLSINASERLENTVNLVRKYPVTLALDHSWRSVVATVKKRLDDVVTICVVDFTTLSVQFQAEMQPVSPNKNWDNNETT